MIIPGSSKPACKGIHSQWNHGTYVTLTLGKGGRSPNVRGFREDPPIEERPSGLRID